jgi:signal transduction histidine kinase
MAIDGELKPRFWHQIIRNGMHSSASYLVVLTFYLILLSDGARTHWLTILSVLLIFAGTVLRVQQYFKHKKPTHFAIFHVAQKASVSAIIVAVGWSLLCSAGIVLGDEGGSITSLTLLIMSGLGAGQAFRLASVPNLAKMATGITLIPSSIVVAIHFKHGQGLAILGMSLIYFAFLWSQINEYHRHLVEAFQGERAGRTEARMLMGILDAVPGVVSVLDDDLTYRSINQVGRNFLGFDPTGKKLGSQTENPEFEKLVRDFFYSNRSQQSFEIQMDHHGRKNWLFVSMRKLYAPLAGMIVVSIPIDELKSAQIEVESQKAKAEYASRLASLGEMAAGIAHEINNPLSIISARAQFLTRIAEQGEFSSKAISDIKKYSIGIVEMIDRIARIIRGLKTFAKDGMHEPAKTTSISTIIDDTVVFCESRFRSAGISFTVETEEQLFIEARAVQISQVLLNLLNNAFDACEGRSQPHVKVVARRDGNHVQIRVIDNGAGIPVHIREKIMQPFFTTKEVGKGTGLGLSISQGIIAAHQGKLTLDPRTDQTEFVIELPIVMDLAKASA